MLDVLTPGKLVLTLQSTPPFVAESALALTLTILLAAPLIVRLYFLLDKPLKSLTKRTVSSSRRCVTRQNRSLVTHYPIESATTRSPKNVDSTSSSSLHLEGLHQADSTSTLRSDKRSAGWRCRRSGADLHVRKRIGLENRDSTNSKHRRSSDCSSSCADTRRPTIIDVSDLDYGTYRHRLIEATLRRQYDDYQPPGDVVLNSLHLNTADSVMGVRLNDRYEHSLFDFVEDYYDAANKMRNRKNDRSHHPLDYFLTRGERRPRTSEKETATIENINRKSTDRESVITGNRSAEGANTPPRKLPRNSVDSNGNPRVYSPARSISFDDSIVAIARNDLDSAGPPRDGTVSPFRADNTEKKGRRGAGSECPRSPGSVRRIGASSWTTRNRPSSAGSASSAPRDLSRTVVASPTAERRKGVTKLLSRPSRSAGCEKNPSNRPEAVEERDSNFVISASSSEIVSDSSRHREDETSFRSRESSISPRSGGRASRPPWMSGCRGTSFNRKYGNTARDSAARSSSARPTSAHGGSGLSAPTKLAASSKRRRSNECFPAASVSRNPTSPELRGRGASLVATRGTRELIGTLPAEQRRRRRDENLPAISACQQRDKLKDAVGRLAAGGGNENDGATSRTRRSPGKGASAISTTAIAADDDDDDDDAAAAAAAATVASQFLSSTGRVRPAPRADSSEVAASAAVSRTCATKGTARLTSNRSGNDARRTPGVVQNQRESSAKLNRDGRRQLKSVENPPRGGRGGGGGGGTSLSSKIELSARVLNPADDTDKSAITLVEERRAIDPRKRNASPSSVETVAGNARPAAKSDEKFNVARPKVQKSKIVANLQRRPASANSLSAGRSATSGTTAQHSARRNANSETKSGLNGAKLNSRSNGTVDGIRRAGSWRASSSVPSESSVVDETKGTTRRDAFAARISGAELKLPRRDSKVGLAMNSALRKYIETLKQGDKDGVALASLSLGDAISILSEQKTPLSPEEIRELQSVLDKVEKHPELLCKESPLDIEGSSVK